MRQKLNKDENFICILNFLSKYGEEKKTKWHAKRRAKNVCARYAMVQTSAKVPNTG